MNEGTVKSTLVKRLRDSGLTVIRHEDRSTSGIPDIEIPDSGFTTWWEVKYGTPESPWKTKGIQHLQMLKLSGKGKNAWYIIFEETSEGKQVSIAHPRSLGKTRKQDRREEWNTVERFNYDWLVSEINLIHIQRRINE